LAIKVLVDTNIILDVLLKRSEFYASSYQIFKLSEQSIIDGFVSASAMTDIFYIVSKNSKTDADIYQILEDIIGVFSIAAVTPAGIIGALALHWKDFEDAVQYMTAKEHGFDYIVTRNKDDYETAAIPCISPAEFIDMYTTQASSQEMR
jgi:predicted nucleic acid-binding protein